MHNQSPKFVKPSTHKADVIKTLISVFLMFVCFGTVMYGQNHHWETRQCLAFMIPGICYLLTVLGFTFQNGVA